MTTAEKNYWWKEIYEKAEKIYRDHGRNAMIAFLANQPVLSYSDAVWMAEEIEIDAE